MNLQSCLLSALAAEATAENRRMYDLTMIGSSSALMMGFANFYHSSDTGACVVIGDFEILPLYRYRMVSNELSAIKESRHPSGNLQTDCQPILPATYIE